MEKNDPEKWKDFASYALSVPRDEIHIVTCDKEPSRTKVNINLTRDFNAEGRTAVSQTSVGGKHVLGEIDADVDNDHDVPF